MIQMQFRLKRTIIYECERKASKESVGPSELCGTRRMRRMLPLAKPRVPVLTVPTFPSVVENEVAGIRPISAWAGPLTFLITNDVCSNSIDLGPAARSHVH